MTRSTITTFLLTAFYFRFTFAITIWRDPMSTSPTSSTSTLYREHSREISSQTAHHPTGSFIHPALLPHVERKPKLLDQVRQAIRVRHYSLRTEDTYIHWIKRFIFFHNKRHPREMGGPEIR